MNLNGAWAPRACGGYPFDFDGSLRFTRPKTGIDYFPYPPRIGMVSGFMPQLDSWVWAQGYGKNAYGPGTTQPVVNLGYQVTVPGLNKYTAQPGA